MKSYLKNLLTAVLCFALFSCSSEQIQIEAQNDTINIEDTKIIEAEILNLINEHRNNLNLPLLGELEIIKSQTQAHTKYMIEKGELSHDFFYERKQFLVSKTDASDVSENVAYGYTSARTVVNAWLNSDGHKQNIEGDFTHFNVTAQQNEEGKWYYTNIFIKN